MPVYRPTDLHRLRHRPKKSLSQNFLIDRNIIRKALSAAKLEHADRILEIGPGHGAITEELLARGANVFCVEKDPALAENLANKDNLRVLCADALTFPLNQLQPKTKIVANLPYHITTPIIERFIKQPGLISSMTLFVQHEVGMRICAQADTADYSSLSLFVQSYCTPQYCFSVSPTCFFPAPSVRSCVIHLEIRPFAFDVDEKPFFEFTRTAFGKKRKMLRGTLRNFTSAENVEKALKNLGKSPLARPGELSPSDFASLYISLNQTKSQNEDVE